MYEREYQSNAEKFLLHTSNDNKVFYLTTRETESFNTSESITCQNEQS